MIDDLRHLPDDSFQLIEPDAAELLICALGICILIFWPYLAP